MNDEKWNNILIEWVNCLKLCKSISGIDELRSCEFFCNLQKVITKSRNIQLDLLTFVFDLFAKHYPYISFENKKEIHLSDLPTSDLKLMTSLLMHYTCIYDRKDVLTSPLCHSLSQTTQLIIRNFLQKITKDVTNPIMNDIIKSCIDDASDHLTNNHWLSDETSMSKNSPLQELLKTPVSKFGRIHEKDKLISKLKSELESERYEKTELQEELKMQLEKNKKIEQQLSQKNNEIFRLRAEVVSLENCTSPHYQDMDSRELQRRLRAEIQSLEQYIKQIENEHDEIRSEKDIISEQLRKVEQQSSIWEEKFFETECKFESLNEHAKKQEEELRELQVHCSEITALLEEYKSKSLNDSSFYDTFTSPNNENGLSEIPSCEDLACSVVEVQLRDAQKQNEDLKLQIQQFEENQVQLRNAIVQADEKLKKSEEVNEELILKIKNLERDKERIQKRLIEVENDFVKAKEHNQDTATKMKNITVLLHEQSEDLQESKKQKDDLTSKVQQLQLHIEHVEKKLSETMNNWETEKVALQTSKNELNDAQAVSEKLQFELADALLNNQKVNSQLDGLKIENKTLMTNLKETENVRRDLEFRLNESLKLADNLRSDCNGLQDENHRIKEEHSIIKVHITILEGEKAELISNLEQQTERSVSLEKMNEKLSADVISVKEQLKNSLETIDFSKKQIKALEDNETFLNKELSEIQTSLEEMTAAYAVLQNDRQLIFENLNETEENLRALEKDKLQLFSQLRHLEGSCTDLQNKNDKFLLSNENLQKELQVTIGCLETNKMKVEKLTDIQNSLKMQIQEREIVSATLKKALEELQIENQIASETLKEKEADCQQSKELCCNLQKKNEHLLVFIDDLQKNLFDLKEEMKCSEEDLQTIRNDRNLLQGKLRDADANLEMLKKNLHKTELEKQNLIEKLEGSKNQLTDALEALKVSREESNQLRNIKVGLEMRLEEAHSETDKFKSECEKLRTENCDLNSRFYKYRENAVLLEEQKNVLLQKIDTFKNENEKLNQQVQDLMEHVSTALSNLEFTEIQSRELKDNNIELKGQLDQTYALSENLKCEIAEIKIQLKESQEEWIKVNTAKKNLEDQFEELQGLHTDLEMKLNVLEEYSKDEKCKINELVQENKSINDNLEESKETVLKLEKEKNSLLAKLQHLEIQNEELLTTVKNLEEMLSEEKKITSNGKFIQDTLEKKIIDLWASLEEAQIGKQKINDVLVNLKNESDILISKLQDSDMKCFNLEKQICDEKRIKAELETNLETFKMDFDHVLLQRQKMISKLKESEKNRRKLENEKAELTMKVEELKEKVDELEKKNQDLLTQNCNMEKHIEELKTTYASLDLEYQKNKEIMEEIMDEKQEIAKTLKYENETLIVQLTELKLKSDEIEKNNENLSLTNQNLHDRIEEIITSKERTVLEYQKCKDSLEEYLKEKDKTENAIVEERDSLIRKLLRLEQNSDQIENKNEELLAENETLQKIICDMRTSKEQIEQDFQNIEKSLSELTNEKHQCELKIKDYLTQNEELCQHNEEFKRQLYVLEADHNELKNKKEIIEKKLNEVSNLSETLKVESEEVRVEYQKCKSDLEKAKDEIAILIKQKENLTQLLKKAEENNADLQMELSKSTSNLERSKQNIICKEDKEIELRESLNQLEDKNQIMTYEAKMLQQQIIDIENNNKEKQNLLESELGKLASLASGYKSELEVTVKRAEELQNENIEVKDALSKLQNDNQELISKNDLLQQYLVDVEIKNKDDQNLLQAKVCQLNSLVSDYNDKLANAMKRAEKAEQNYEHCKIELTSVSQRLERLSQQNSDLEKKIEVENLITSQNQERVKSLEETVQDYEITISGLKNVVDTNLEITEVLKDELSRKKSQESDTIKLIINLLQDNNITCDEEGQGDLKTFICESVMKILKAEGEKDKRIMDLESEIIELKTNNTNLNSSFKEMVEKLQSLVMDDREIKSMDALKSCFQKIHTNIKNALENKEVLSENLRKADNDKLELYKQIEVLKSEKEQIIKTKTELEINLKEEKEKTENLLKELERKSKSNTFEKENILGVSTKQNKSREEELKKENMMLKRKVVLTEHAKHNLEKVLKELREEKKSLAIPSSPSNDGLYKKLLQEYIQVKEDHERIVKERDDKIRTLVRENEQIKVNTVQVKMEDDKKLIQDLHNIREAYGNIMSINSKLELEIVSLRKVIEERNSEMANLSHIKEAYEKLLEENSKIMTEIDTVKYKRMRDKEEFVRLLKKEREENANREVKRVQEIRSEYEGKLEKMKEKMLKLYREEVNKKVKSVKDGENESAHLLKTVANLKSELFEADQKIQLLEMEKEILKANKRLDVETRSVQMQSTSSISSIVTNDEKAATLPRPTITKEITISQRTSIAGISNCIAPQNLQMEDEEDLFNDKYLTDLKEGRCGLRTDRESTSRFSELAWRNSMVPPHLKSSYPAEMQFISPTRFKDEDIKTGNIEFEDSLCKLLPGEKPRKKDFGTTSYKRPGPPTPSKNGGRLSLQGNEVHPMREHCETKTPKKSTPSRIKALFTGRNSSARDGLDSQNNVTPSRGKRLSFFRRPR